MPPAPAVSRRGQSEFGRRRLRPTLLRSGAQMSEAEMPSANHLIRTRFQCRLTPREAAAARPRFSKHRNLSPRSA
jgi:hypothetical protein